MTAKKVNITVYGVKRPPLKWYQRIRFEGSFEWCFGISVQSDDNWYNCVIIVLPFYKLRFYYNQ